MAMTHVCCSSCRLRFIKSAAAFLVVCPKCGAPPRLIQDAAGVVGFGVYTPEDPPRVLPEAVAVSIPISDPGRERS